MPAICFLNSETVNEAFAALRDISRPAPCGADWFQSSLPFPVQIRLPSRIFIGMSSFSPARAETAPFRRIICSVSI